MVLVKRDEGRKYSNLKTQDFLGCHFDVAVKLEINKVKYFNDNNKDDDVNDS